ncbi:hypothetical protein ACFWD3_10715, partial [Micrococcus luteus]
GSLEGSHGDRVRAGDGVGDRGGLHHYQGLNSVECGVADLMALIRATADATGNDEYDVRVGIEWTGSEPLVILTVDNFGHSYGGVSTPLHRYIPVESTVNASAADLDFYWGVHDLAQDCVNQGGVSNVRMIQPPDRTE